MNVTVFAPSRTATRRSLLGAAAAAALGSLLTSSEARAANAPEAVQLPPAQPDPDDPFAVDLNVNMETIDDYLGIPGVCYRDMRMVLARHDEKTGETKFFLWRADITVLDFSQLTEIGTDSDTDPGGRAGSQA